MNGLNDRPHPGLLLLEGRIVRRMFEMSCDGIGWTIFPQPEISLWYVLSLGRGNR